MGGRLIAVRTAGDRGSAALATVVALHLLAAITHGAVHETIPVRLPG